MHAHMAAGVVNLQATMLTEPAKMQVPIAAACSRPCSCSFSRSLEEGHAQNALNRQGQARTALPATIAIPHAGLALRRSQHIMIRNHWHGRKSKQTW